MSQINPTQVDSTNLDGWKKIAANIIGLAGSAVVGVLTDPVHAATANQATALALTLAPAGVTAIYTVVQGIIDMFKVHNAGRVAEAQVTPTITVSGTPSFANPDYGKRQVSQAEELANQVIPVQQLSPNKPNLAMTSLAAMEKLVSSDEGAFQYLLGTISETLDREYQRYITASLQPLEALQKVVAQYLNVDLTPQDCEAISANKNLATILHSYADKTILASIYTAHKAGTLGKSVWEGVMIRALYYARKNVVESLQKKLTSENIVLVREAMADLGLNEYTQRTAQSEGPSWRVWLHGGFQLLNPAAELGLDSETYLPL